AISVINPLSYQVDALRGLLVGTHSDLLLDVGVLLFALVIGVTTASALLGRLARA
ncbi:MAG: multidrug ABC transporter permease, partial [Candidatus Dormibacteraeota bacterium]|nr:multidrug ABC transporter permease [Candidatus Dormibacteraeota bacterium]